ncbi:hypothetical protein [Bacillus kwashiorkori]|uniref:hypothetical protein n=1 Tax=Bacillus kwashiorkori TaxID=1522318 RepID=UPI000785E1E5|nr:hypothetical protein [Bacillus kwashiorkori]
MLSSLFRKIIMLTTAFMIYKNRYRIMNWVLSFPTIRQVAVSTTMKIPLIRKMFFQSTFRSDVAGK